MVTPLEAAKEHPAVTLTLGAAAGYLLLSSLTGGVIGTAVGLGLGAVILGKGLKKLSPAHRGARRRQLPPAPPPQAPAPADDEMGYDVFDSYLADKHIDRSDLNGGRVSMTDGMMGDDGPSGSSAGTPSSGDGSDGSSDGSAAPSDGSSDGGGDGSGGGGDGGGGDGGGGGGGNGGGGGGGGGGSPPGGGGGGSPPGGGNPPGGGGPPQGGGGGYQAPRPRAARPAPPKPGPGRPTHPSHHHHRKPEGER